MEHDSMQAQELAELIKGLIRQVKEKQEPALLFPLLMALSDAQVAVPTKVAMSDEDTDKLLHARVGDTVTMDSEVRLRPDFLKGNDSGVLFFPVFTSPEETEESYRSAFSWVTLPFLTCCRSAQGVQECGGVVVNGFSDPFVVDRQMIDLTFQLQEYSKPTAST